MEKISFLYDMEKEEAAAVLDGWMVVLRREMLKSMEEQGSLERRSTEKMKTAIDRTAVAREDILERNVNLRLALENLVLSFK